MSSTSSTACSIPAPMRLFRRRNLVVVVSVLNLLIISGCAVTSDIDSRVHRADKASAEPAHCRQWFRHIDAQVHKHGAPDAQAHRIPDFPHLRVNRHLAAAGESIATPKQTADWLNRLRALDQRARQSELLNLPAAAVLKIMTQAPTIQTEANTVSAIGANAAVPEAKTFEPSAARPNKARLIAATNACGQLLLEQDLSNPLSGPRIRANSTVPDHYTIAGRTIGIYPLSRLAVGIGVRAWERETVALFEEAAPAGAARIASGYARAGQEAVAKLLASRRTDSLGIPVITAEVSRWLLREFAPVFHIDQQGPFDKPGKVEQDASGTSSINSEQPVVYSRLAFTRYGGQSLIQLVYTIWFSERPVQSAFDIYAGKLDGVVIRITLNSKGQPAVIDTIHACGCYHLFFNTPAAKLRARPDNIGKLDEWRFMPGKTINAQPKDRLQVHIQSATHYVRGVSFGASGSTSNGAITIVPLVSEESLTVLPADTDGNTRSLYSANGIVPGTNRSERWLLWPMGIRSAGAMRQWGTHATAFVGRRHFDDGHLIEDRFIIP